MTVSIFMYHGVERRPGPLFVDPDLFEQQLDAIAAAGVAVLTVGEVAERLASGSLPPRAVALTFDDAFASVASEAAPRLAARGLRATVFCVAGRIGATNDWATAKPGGPEVALASLAELHALRDAGFELGAHGVGHAPLDTDDGATIEREVVEARGALEVALGTPVRSFAYPYGASPSAAATRAVAATYDAACSTRLGHAGPRSDVHALPRIDAHYVRSLDRFTSVLTGGARAYLGLRRAGARARRLAVRDYVRA